MIRQTLPMRRDSGSTVEVEFEYDPDWDPTLMVLTFPDVTGGARWEVGRYLLRAGLRRPAGYDAVKVRPQGVDVAIALTGDASAPDAAEPLPVEEVFLVSRDDLASLVAATYAITPAQVEQRWVAREVDALIARCLGGVS